MGLERGWKLVEGLEEGGRGWKGVVDDLHWSATTPSGPCSPTSRPRLIILPKKLVITFTQPALVCLSHLQAVLQLATCPLLTYLLQSSSNASQTHQAHFILRTCQICQIVEHNFAGTKTRHIDQLFAKVHKWLRKLRKEGNVSARCQKSAPRLAKGCNWENLINLVKVKALQMLGLKK